MEEPVRKLSLIQFAYMPWPECSGTHKGVRKRTAGASNLSDWQPVIRRIQ